MEAKEEWGNDSRYGSTHESMLHCSDGFPSSVYWCGTSWGLPRERMQGTFRGEERGWDAWGVPQDCAPLHTGRECIR